MEHHTASTSPIPYSGEDWFDPLEDAIRFRVRAFIEAVVAEEAQAALGGRERYQRCDTTYFRAPQRNNNSSFPTKSDGRPKVAPREFPVVMTY